MRGVVVRREWGTPSPSILLLLRLIEVMDLFDSSAVASALAPSPVILLWLRLIVVMELFDSSAVASAMAPSLPILLSMRSI